MQSILRKNNIYMENIRHKHTNRVKETRQKAKLARDINIGIDRGLWKIILVKNDTPNPLRMLHKCASLFKRLFKNILVLI